MNVVHALEPLQKSIFLAGPTPRDPNVESWRPEALRIMKEKFQFDGTVYVPEANDWSAHDNYDAQINWEWEAINQATVVLFWVPRDLQDMPAFTTNVEFGYLESSGKLVLGYPLDAPKMSYLDAMAKKHGVQVCHELTETIMTAIWMANNTHMRTVRK